MKKKKKKKDANGGKLVKQSNIINGALFKSKSILIFSFRRFTTRQPSVQSADKLS